MNWIAYIDPTAGGFLLQLIFGGLAGTAVLVKMQWKRIRAFFGAGRKAKSPAK